MLALTGAHAMLFCLLTVCYIKCPPAARFLSHGYFLMTQQSSRIYETRINLFWKAQVLANNLRLCQRLNVNAAGCLMPALWQWEKRGGGGMQRFWNEPNTKGPSLRRASSSGSSLDILSAPRKGMLEEGWHFTQNPLFIQGQGQLSDCLHQSGGQLPERKVRSSVLLWVLLHRIDCSPGFITGADTHGLTRFCLLGLTEISWHSSLTDLCFHQLRS